MQLMFPIYCSVTCGDLRLFTSHVCAFRHFSVLNGNVAFCDWLPSSLKVTCHLQNWVKVNIVWIQHYALKTITLRLTFMKGCLVMIWRSGLGKTYFINIFVSSTASACVKFRTRCWVPWEVFFKRQRKQGFAH